MTVRRAVTLIRGEIATIPFKVYKAAPRKDAKAYPAYKLVHDWASDWQSAGKLRQVVTTDALLTGNGFALVRRNAAGVPIFMHQIAPASVSIAEDIFGAPVYHVRLQGQDVKVLNPSDVLHVQCPGGVSPVIHARKAIALADAAEQHLSGFFKNGGRPSGVIRHPEKIDTATAEKLTKSWFTSHSGEQAGSTAVLDEGMSFQEIALNLADAEFSEVRRDPGVVRAASRMSSHSLARVQRRNWR